MLVLPRYLQEGVERVHGHPYVDSPRRLLFADQTFQLLVGRRLPTFSKANSKLDQTTSYTTHSTP